MIDVNNDPVAVNDSISLNENETTEETSASNGVLSNDSDSDGDSITLENFRTGLETGSGADCLPDIHRYGSAGAGF